jgi:hypothetical protein
MIEHITPIRIPIVDIIIGAVPVVRTIVNRRIPIPFTVIRWRNPISLMTQGSILIVRVVIGVGMLIGSEFCCIITLDFMGFCRCEKRHPHGQTG